MEYKVISSTPLYNDGRFRLTKNVIDHDRFDGGKEKNLVRILFERRPCVGIVAYDPYSREVVLVEQFRIGLMHTGKPWSSEVPAGIIDAGETPEEAAARECLEETGAVAKALTPIMKYHSSSGGSSEEIHLFLAIVDMNQVKAYCGVAEEKEDIKTHIVSLDAALKMVNDGLISSAHTIIGLLSIAQRFK